VNLIARLHDLLLEIEEDLGEAGLLFGKSKDGFIDDLQTEDSTDAFTPRVGDVEPYACIGAWFVDRRIGGGLDLQLIGGLYEDEAMVGDRLGVTTKEIGIDVERASHLWRCVEGEVDLSVLQVEVARKDGLPVFDDIDVNGATSPRGEDL
jgi:hypothetical protein